jgi:hypothetical protein
MRRRPSRVAPLALLALAALAGTAARAGGEMSTERYRELLHQKRTLLREASQLKREAEWAAGKLPYIFFNMESGQLEFRLRGKMLKSYSVQGIFLDERLRRPATAEAIWRALDEPITLREKQGGRPELVPPDPEAGRETGLLYSDPNHLATQTGAKPIDTDAGVLGVDAPTEYYIEFEEKVIFFVRSPRTPTLRERAADRFSEMVSAVSGLFGGERSQGDGKHRLKLYLVIEPEIAKYLHYSLLPGEKLVLVPPPPPPVVLVASGSGPAEIPASR